MDLGEYRLFFDAKSFRSFNRFKINSLTLTAGAGRQWAF